MALAILIFGLIGGYLIHNSQAATVTNPPKAVHWSANTTPGSLDKDTSDMQAAGITWARVSVYSTTPTSYLDQVVNTAKSRGITILPVVWGIPERDLGTETDRQNFKNWLASIVSRYKADIKVWEIHNEQNLSFWNIPLPTDPGYNAAVHNYVLHLQDAHSTIKKIDPSLQVMMGGLSSWTMEPYMDRLLVEEAHKWFDIIAYHPYGTNPDDVIRRMDALRSKMLKKRAMAGKPIWITEIGFGNADINGPYPGIVPNEQTKAQYLSLTYAKLKSWGIKTPIFWYTFTEGNSNNWETSVNGYSLVRRHPDGRTTYLPAYNYMKDIRPNTRRSVLDL